MTTSTDNNNVGKTIAELHNEDVAREALKGILDRYMFSSLNGENFKTPLISAEKKIIFPEYYAKLHVSKTFLIDFVQDSERDKNIWENYALPTVVLSPDMILNVDSPEIIMKEIQRQIADTNRFPREL